MPGELVKSPEHFHTRRITPLPIWNAHAAGIRDQAARFGRLEPAGPGRGVRAHGRRHLPRPAAVRGDARDRPEGLGKLVEYGARGRVELTTLTKEFFLPPSSSATTPSAARPARSTPGTARAR
ncbi:MAG: hypothetical protein HOP15_14285 [Planctomycetes bacterium]|nr:hypothetical protein [Planctomycetota bacterium]